MKIPKIYYLHGFASGKDSTKGIYIEKYFNALGFDTVRLSLNIPSFEKQTVSNSLSILEQQITDEEVFLAGSSLGAFTAATWAAENPSRVKSLFLISPAFNLTEHFSKHIGDENLEIWKNVGFLPIPDSDGVSKNVHYEFFSDLGKYAGIPEISVPAVICHGLRDTLIPIKASRDVALLNSGIKLIETDDDHNMSQSLEVIVHHMEKLFVSHIRSRDG
ncbi:MAG: alpha/beta fold hydrolase [Deltaproteobacteria bacterium]|nr:alpha/beta fold hydrolase [Deltaproteobacteria bacterium]